MFVSVQSVYGLESEGGVHFRYSSFSMEKKNVWKCISGIFYLKLVSFC